MYMLEMVFTRHLIPLLIKYRTDSSGVNEEKEALVYLDIVAERLFDVHGQELRPGAAADAEGIISGVMDYYHDQQTPLEMEVPEELRKFNDDFKSILR